MIAIDLETCDPDLQTHGCGAHREGCFIAGVAVGTEAGFREYFPVAHQEGPNLPRDKVFAWLREQLALPVPKVGAYLPYDLQFLAAAGIRVEGPLYDIQVADPLLCETRFSYSLDELAKVYLDEGKDEAALNAFLKSRFHRKKSKEIKNDIWRCPPDIVAPYAEADVDLPLRIFAQQRPLLEQQGLWDLFVMESKLIPMLVEMRRRGVRVDLDKAEQMDQELGQRQEQLLVELNKIAGRSISIWAAKDLAQIFDASGTKYGRTPKTDAPSITADWLEEQSDPAAAMILEVRKIDKLRGTFLQGSIIEKHHAGRIHANFNQLRGEGGGAVSGRFSSSMPNLQFIPVRSDLGKKIRSIFLPDEGCLFAKLDYSQIEFRLIVHDAVERRLRGAREVADEYAMNPDADFHQKVAEMAGVDRRFAKTINFGLAYGEGVAKLARQLGLSLPDAERLLNEYHSRVPFIRQLAWQLRDEADSAGIVRTLLDRRRRFDRWAVRLVDGKTVYHDRRVARSTRAFTHKALNARIQGSAADVMKAAMVKIYEDGVMRELGVPHLTVHDELDFSVPDTPAGREALREACRIMEQCVDDRVRLRVPMKVDAEWGANWGDGEKFNR
jgi:DNA polymerase I-like protein with 3'-5' exonuclease and polymerase domains